MLAAVWNSWSQIYWFWTTQSMMSIRLNQSLVHLCTIKQYIFWETVVQIFPQSQEIHSKNEWITQIWTLTSIPTQIDIESQTDALDTKNNKTNSEYAELRRLNNTTRRRECRGTGNKAQVASRNVATQRVPRTWQQGANSVEKMETRHR